MYIFFNYFMLFMKRGLSLLAMSLLLVVLAAGFSQALEASSVLLKVSLKQGDSSTRVISLSSDEGGEAGLEIINVRGVTVSEESFILNAGERKQVQVTFDSKGLDAGVYVGSIIINSGKDVSVIPVIFEVESVNNFFDINLDIPPQYTDIAPGEKFIAQVKVFDLTSGGTSEGLGATNVDTEYYLFDLEGKILSSETESIVVDKQARITKTLTIPEDIEEGDYVFVSLVKHKEKIAGSTQLFSVSEKDAGGLFNISAGNFDFGFVFISGIFIFIFLSVIGFFIFMVRDRDKLLIELRKYNSLELRRQKELLLVQERLLSSRKEISRKVVRREVKEKIKKLKVKHKERIREFKRLRKIGNKTAMIRKLEQWKNEGYNTLGLESKLKEMDLSEMKKIMSKWRREGYNVGKPKSIKRK